MANSANKYFEERGSEDSLKETILCQNPVPDNLDNFEELDNFLRDILNEKRRINEQNIENVLEKLQRKTVDMMGSLSKLWNILEGAKGSEEDAVQISINDLLHYVEQTVLLLRQSSNAITYHRRLNVLGTVMNFQYQVKSMLKENASLLQKHDEYLFGKKFRNHIADTIKSTKQTKEILIKYKKLFSFSYSHAPRKCEGQKKVFLKKAGSKKFHNDNQQQQQQRHTYYEQTVSQQQRYGIKSRDMELNPEKPMQWESKKIHSLIKRLFLPKSIPDVPLAGRLKHFVGAWMKITQNPKILDIVKGHKIPFDSKPFQSKIASQPIVTREGEELVKLEVKEMLRKGAIRKVQPLKGEFVRNLFLVKKKDGGQRPVTNLKQLNAYIPCCHFKTERLQNLSTCCKEDVTCSN